MKSGSLRFAFLATGFLCVFFLLYEKNSPDKNPEVTETQRSKKSACLLLAASPYFTDGKKAFGSQKFPFFTDKEIQEWATVLKKRFTERALFFYLPLYRTKDNRWLISSKGFFPSHPGFSKISHHKLSHIQNILQPEDSLATLKGFLQHFPKEKLFLNVFETDAEKAQKSLHLLIKQPAFISSNNEPFLELISQERLFKPFYSFKYLIRLSLAGMVQRGFVTPGAGLLLPQEWLPEVTVREEIRQQGKMLFLKTSGPFKKTVLWKGAGGRHCHPF